MATHHSVDAYIAGLLPPIGAVAARARAAIDEHLAGASCAIRWAHPTWSVGREPVCYLKAASRHVTFGFWHGASIADPSGRLERSGQVMAHVKLRNIDDLDEARFGDWLRQAGELVSASPRLGERQQRKRKRAGAERRNSGALSLSGGRDGEDRDAD